MLGVGSGIADQHLQAMANAGTGTKPGQPNAPYYLANSPQQMQDAFNQIIGGVLSCELAINGSVDPTSAKNGTVTLDGRTLSFGTDWDMLNPTTIRLLGATCTMYQNSTNPTLDASFPCGTVIL